MNKSKSQIIPYMQLIHRWLVVSISEIFYTCSLFLFDFVRLLVPVYKYNKMNKNKNNTQPRLADDDIKMMENKAQNKCKQ